MKLVILFLARIVIGEAGWQATEADDAAHHAVLASRAARMGVSYRTAAALYAPRHVGVATSRRPWIAELDWTLRRPASWPSRASWSAHKPHWVRILGLAARAHRGELAHPCDGEPHHWGGPGVDHERIERGIARGYWRRLDCGSTSNVFLEVLEVAKGGER